MPVISGGVVQGPGNCLQQSVLFTETAGAGTYTGSVTIPAGCFLLEVIVHGVALWDNAGAVDMIVGDSQAVTGDPDGIFVITSLKSGGDLNATQSISVHWWQHRPDAHGRGLHRPDERRQRRQVLMPKLRRFPTDEVDEAPEVTEAPTLRRRPADKRYRRPHSDKSQRPDGAPSVETNPDAR